MFEASAWKTGVIYGGNILKKSLRPGYCKDLAAANS